MHVPYYHWLYISEKVFKTNIKHKYSLYESTLNTALNKFYPEIV